MIALKRNGIVLLTVLAVGLVIDRGAHGQQPTTITLTLVQGWNNIAYLGPPVPAARLATAIGPGARTLWEYDAVKQMWRGFDPNVPLASDLGEIAYQRAIWVYMTQPGVLQMRVAQVATSNTLYPGMNNIAYVGQEVSLAEALAPTGGRVRGVWRWNAASQRWQGAVPSNPQASEFTLISPGQAYSIRLEDGPAITLRPAEAAGETVAARPRGCHPFEARQPQLSEVRSAFNKVGFGQLVGDSQMSLPRLETQPDGDGGLVPGYIPPTLLKAIGWTESSWRQAEYEAPRGARGRALASKSCAFGVMQVLSGMDIKGTPTPLQERIGADFQHNIAAGARILAEKWNLAPSALPLVRPRSPASLEDWYYAVWAYHCFGARCREMGLHDNPDDPALTWPRPVYNSPEQLASRGQFSRADYPYQELVYGLVQHPPRADGAPLWTPLLVKLPPRGAVGFPTPGHLDPHGFTTDPTRADEP